MSEQKEQKAEVKPKSKEKATKEGRDTRTDGKKETRSSRPSILFLTKNRTQGQRRSQEAQGQRRWPEAQGQRRWQEAQGQRRWQEAQGQRRARLQEAQEDEVPWR